MSRKIFKLLIALDSVFVIVFNAFFFMIGGFEHNASVWISYAFIHLAYVMMALTPFLIKGKRAMTSGLAIYTISSAYFFIEFVVGLIFIFLSLNNYKPTLLIQLLFAAAYAVPFIINLIANEHTLQAEEGRKIEIEYIKNATNAARRIASEIKDRKLRRAVEKLADELAASPTKSHPDLQSIELEIYNNIESLDGNSTDEDSIAQTVDKVYLMVKDRNRKLKSIQ